MLLRDLTYNPLNKYYFSFVFAYPKNPPSDLESSCSGVLQGRELGPSMFSFLLTLALPFSLTDFYFYANGKYIFMFCLFSLFSALLQITF